MGQIVKLAADRDLPHFHPLPKYLLNLAFLALTDLLTELARRFDLFKL